MSHDQAEVNSPIIRTGKYNKSLHFALGTVTIVAIVETLTKIPLVYSTLSILLLTDFTMNEIRQERSRFLVDLI